MAYETGTASSIEDLMNALNTFAVANGWTSDVFSATNDWMGLNNGSVYVQFRWDNTSAFAIFHSLGFINTSTAPGNHTNDDGSASVDASAPYNATISLGRRVNGIGNGPFTAYHFFTDGTTKYIHCVLEYSPGLFRHWSFGTINKIGDWTGGQYAVGHVFGSNAWRNSQNSILFDDVSGTTNADANLRGTLHVEGFSNQAVGGKWMVMTIQTSTLGNDRGGTARISGPGGQTGQNPWLASLGFVRANLLNGFVPLIPIPLWWRNTTPTPNQYMLLGHAPDMWSIQIGNFAAGDEFTIGSDTYKVFPLVRKQTTQASEGSLYAGVAYRKVV